MTTKANQEALQDELARIDSFTKTVMLVEITPNGTGNPPGKLADAELHFIGGPLDGYKLIGFSIWERRSTADYIAIHGRYNVTFPARQYVVNGDRRSFALLRPRDGANNPERLKKLIVDAYEQYAQKTAEAQS